MGKGRSRSRSRTRGRSRSRSLSKGRERERDRERGRGRDWSRSRSESRSDGYVYSNDHRRSRSPIGDYRRQSHGWSDRRSGPEKSSQTCRDFASGGCRKGSQCRFFHPTSISRRESDFVEDDRVESWRGRSVHSQISRHSYNRSGFESRNDVTDLYHGEDEQFLNRSRSRSSIPCRDFKAGSCRWGENCRYSHDFASGGSYGQDSRNTIYNREDFDHQQHKNEKPLCKFFAAGNCSRVNCKFPHEEPNLNYREARLDKVTESQSSYDKNYWNAQKWDDTARISNTPMSPPGWGEAVATNTTSTGNLNSIEGRLDKVTESQSSYDKNWQNAPKWDDVTRIDTPNPTTGWGEAIATNTTSIGDATDGQSDDRWGLNSKNENKIWGIQDHMGNSLNSERQPSLPRESVSYGGDTGPAKSIAVDNIPNKPEHLILHGAQLQNNDGMSSLHGFSPLLENQSLTVEGNIPPASHMQQQHFGETKSNAMASFGSSVLDEVKDIRYANHPVLLSGQSFNQNGTNMFPGHSSAPKENDRVQNMLYTDLTNGHGTDLKQHETQAIKHLNVPIRAENDRRNVLSPGYLESKVPQILTNLLSRMRSDQVSNASVTNAGQQFSSVTDPVSLIQSLVNERSQTYASIDVSSSKGTLPSFSSIPGSLPLASSTDVQDNVRAVSLDQSNSMGNNREDTEPGNDNFTQGTDQNNLMQARRSSPSSIVGTGVGVESPKLKHPESPKQQGEMNANGVTGDGKATDEESKGIHENKPSEDGEGKLEEGSANKDEKGLRLFKNSLVEFVKEILKPTWKEGRMSRDVHKTVVKKVVDKVSTTVQVEHIPKTQDKIDQYLSLSKPKITKLVQVISHYLRTFSLIFIHERT